MCHSSGGTDRTSMAFQIHRNPAFLNGNPSKIEWSRNDPNFVEIMPSSGHEKKKVANSERRLRLEPLWEENF